MLVINLFGSPGAGKSSGAAYIFSKLKMIGVNAELITEFPKEKVWEESKKPFKPNNQVYLFGEQFYRQSRCEDEVDVLVTDSPLPLSILYNKSPILDESFDKVVMNCFNSFNNLSYLVLRDKPYNPKGRFQTEEESDALVDDLRDILLKQGIPFETIKGNQDYYDKIIAEVFTYLNNQGLV